jgi:hypothetical protein
MTADFCFAIVRNRRGLVPALFCWARPAVDTGVRGGAPSAGNAEGALRAGCIRES